MNLWFGIGATLAYLGIGAYVAAKSMDEEMVVAPSQGWLWFYFINRTLLWPLVIFK